MEQGRIEFLVQRDGKRRAKELCLGYARAYMDLILDGKKMGMYFNKMRASVDEFLDFVERD